MNEHSESPQPDEHNNFSSRELADSLVSGQPEVTTTSAIDKAEATRQELVKAGVEDKFSMLDVPQPDGRTTPALGSSEYKVLRTDGRIEDGWQTYIVGNNIIMTKTEDGKEIHKTMPKKEWFVMQAKILVADKQNTSEYPSGSIIDPMAKQRFESELRYERQKFDRGFNILMATSATAIEMADRSPVKELSTAQDRRVVDFGRVKMNLKDLIESPQIASELQELSKHEKNGRKSIDFVRELARAYQDSHYDEAKERDPIYVSMVKLENGKVSYRLNGGRHRIAAATIAGQSEIEVELNSRRGFLDDELINKLKGQQVHSELADKRRSNTRNYSKEVDVV